MTKYKDQNGKIFEIDCDDDPLIYDDQIDDLKEHGYHIETGDNYDDCLSDDINEIIENLPVEQKFSLAVAMEDYRQKYYDVNSTPSMRFDIDNTLERYGLEYDSLKTCGKHPNLLG